MRGRGGRFRMKVWTSWCRRFNLKGRGCWISTILRRWWLRISMKWLKSECLKIPYDILLFSILLDFEMLNKFKKLFVNNNSLTNLQQSKLFSDDLWFSLGDFEWLVKYLMNPKNIADFFTLVNQEEYLNKWLYRSKLFILCNAILRNEVNESFINELMAVRWTNFINIDN